MNQDSLLDETRYRVIDADTWEDRETGERIRLYGLDAPEASTYEGQVATRRAKEFLANNQPTPTRIGTGYYGRSVSTATDSQGRNINEQFVARGIANSRDYLGAGKMPYGAARVAAATSRMEGIPEAPSLGFADINSVPTMASPMTSKRGIAREAGAGIQRATDALQAGAYATASAVGGLFRKDGEKPNALENFGNRGYMRNMQEAQENAATYSLEQLVKKKDTTFGDWIHWGAGVLGEALPSVAGMIGTGAAGGAVGKLALSAIERNMGRKLVLAGSKRLKNVVGDHKIARTLSERVIANLPKHGARLGALAGSAVPEGGNVYADIQNEYGIRAPGVAAAAGLAIAALDVLGLEAILGTAFKNLSKDTTRSLARRMVTAASSGALKGVIAESPTEAAQELISIIATESQNPDQSTSLLDRVLTQDNYWRIGEAAAAGALFGGVAGGAGGAASGLRAQQQVPSTEDSGAGSVSQTPESDTQTDLPITDDIQTAPDRATTDAAFAAAVANEAANVAPQEPTVATDAQKLSTTTPTTDKNSPKKQDTPRDWKQEVRWWLTEPPPVDMVEVFPDARDQLGIDDVGDQIAEKHGIPKKKFWAYVDSLRNQKKPVEKQKQKAEVAEPPPSTQTRQAQPTEAPTEDSTPLPQALERAAKTGTLNSEILNLEEKISKNGPYTKAVHKKVLDRLEQKKKAGASLDEQVDFIRRASKKAEKSVRKAQQNKTVAKKPSSTTKTTKKQPAAKPVEDAEVQARIDNGLNELKKRVSEEEFARIEAEVGKQKSQKTKLGYLVNQFKKLTKQQKEIPPKKAEAEKKQLSNGKKANKFYVSILDDSGNPKMAEVIGQAYEYEIDGLRFYIHQNHVSETDAEGKETGRRIIEPKGGWRVTEKYTGRSLDAALYGMGFAASTRKEALATLRDKLSDTAFAKRLNSRIVELKAKEKPVEKQKQKAEVAEPPAKQDNESVSNKLSDLWPQLKAATGLKGAAWREYKTTNFSKLKTKDRVAAVQKALKEANDRGRTQRDSEPAKATGTKAPAAKQSGKSPVRTDTKQSERSGITKKNKEKVATSLKDLGELVNQEQQETAEKIKEVLDRGEYVELENGIRLDGVTTGTRAGAAETVDAVGITRSGQPKSWELSTFVDSRGKRKRLQRQAEIEITDKLREDFPDNINEMLDAAAKAIGNDLAPRFVLARNSDGTYRIEMRQLATAEKDRRINASKGGNQDKKLFIARSIKAAKVRGDKIPPSNPNFRHKVVTVTDPAGNETRLYVPELIKLGKALVKADETVDIAPGIKGAYQAYAYAIGELLINGYVAEDALRSDIILQEYQGYNFSEKYDSVKAAEESEAYSLRRKSSKVVQKRFEFYAEAISKIEQRAKDLSKIEDEAAYERAVIALEIDVDRLKTWITKDADLFNSEFVVGLYEMEQYYDTLAAFNNFVQADLYDVETLTKKSEKQQNEESEQNNETEEFFGEVETGRARYTGNDAMESSETTKDRVRRTKNNVLIGKYFNELKNLFNIDNVELVAHSNFQMIRNLVKGTPHEDAVAEAMNQRSFAVFVGDKAYIYVNPDLKTEAQLVKELAHEFGHVIERKFLKEHLDKETAIGKRIKKDYDKFLKDNSQVDPDQYSINEWFADEFAAWLPNKESKPKNILQQAFRRLHDMFKKLINVLGRRKASESVSEFLNNVAIARSRSASVRSQADVSSILVANSFTVGKAVEVDFFTLPGGRKVGLPKAIAESVFLAKLKESWVGRGTSAIAESTLDFGRWAAGILKDVDLWMRTQYNEKGEKIEAYDLIADIFVALSGKAREDSRTVVGKWTDKNGKERTKSVTFDFNQTETVFGNDFEVILQPVKLNNESWFESTRHWQGEWMEKRLNEVLGSIENPDAVLTELQLEKTDAELSEDAKKVREMLEDFFDNYLMPRMGQGHNGGIQRHDNYFPRMFDPSVIDADKQGFMQMLMDNFGLNSNQAENFTNEIINNDGFVAWENLTSSPAIGAPSRKHRNKNFDTPEAAAILSPYYQKDMRHILGTYFHQMVRRAEYEVRMGKLELTHDKDGKIVSTFWNFQGKEKALLEIAGLQGASQAQHNRMVQKNLEAYKGRLGINIDPALRRFQSAIIAILNTLLLPFATLTSLVDIANPTVYTGGRIKGSMKALKGAFAAMKNKDDLYDFATRHGRVADKLVTEAIAARYENPYVSPGVQKYNEKFFRWIGLHHWTNFSRLYSTLFAQDFLYDMAVKNDAKAQAELAKLGVTAEQVLKWHENGRRDWSRTNYTNPKEKAIDQRMATAIFRFVDRTSFHPDASQRPAWASDPHYALIWHLKQFSYSFYKNILTQLTSVAKENSNLALKALAFTPLLMLLPLAMVGMELRNLIQFGFSDLEPYNHQKGAIGYLVEAVNRSGLIGPAQFLWDAAESADRGQMLIASLAGPWATTLSGLFTREVSASIARMTPVASVMPPIRESLRETLANIGE